MSKDAAVTRIGVSANQPNATRYYPSESGILMVGKTAFSVQGDLLNATATFEATNDSTNWIDVTPYAKDLKDNTDAKSNYTGSFLAQINGITVHKIRIKSVTTNPTNRENYTFRAV